MGSNLNFSWFDMKSKPGGTFLTYQLVFTGADNVCVCVYLRVSESVRDGAARAGAGQGQGRYTQRCCQPAAAQCQGRGPGLPHLPGTQEDPAEVPRSGEKIPRPGGNISLIT